MFWKNKRVLVSGANGSLGKNLTAKLKQQQAAAIGFGREDCDLTDSGQVRRFFSKLAGIDFIFHLATFQRTGNVQYEIQAEQFRVNTSIHLNMLDAWRRYLPGAKLISVGCSCSYPEKDTPLCERDYWAGELHDSVEAYGFAKKLMQVGQKAYARQFGMKSLYVILSTVYGPGDNFDSEKSHFVAALVKRITEAKINGSGEVEIWGDGTQVRECVYIDDQIDALLIAAEQIESELLNIGGNQSCTVSRVAEAIKQSVGYDGELFYNTRRFTGVPFKVLDSGRFKELSGFELKDTLESGIQKTVEWFESSICSKENV